MSVVCADRWWWPWAQPNRHEESADEVAARLNRVAGELENATAELRSLVTGLRAVKTDRALEGRNEGRA